MLIFDIRSSPFAYAWALIFRTSRNPALVETIRTLFPDNGNYLEEREFSKLHKIVLGMTAHNLDEGLRVCGATIDACDADGNTPLVWAVRRDDIGTVRFLFNAGANPNVCNKDHFSALMYAAQFLDPTGVKLLLKAGADPRQINHGGSNALHRAAQYQDDREIIKVLARAGINTNWWNNWFITPLFPSASRNHVNSAEALIDLGADLNYRDHDGDTALNNAVHNGADDVMQLLLARGATYNSWTSNGNSILHEAALAGGLRTLDILQQASLKEIDPDAISRQGITPLQVALQRETKPEGFVQKLQELLADIRLRNAELERSRRYRDDGVIHRNKRPYPLIESIRVALTRRLETRWTQDLRNKLRQTVAESTWMTICIYWILGIGWAGFIYLMLERSWSRAFLPPF